MLPFRKMHASGDDFIIVDARGKANPVTRHVALRLGDRNRGIGFNQLAVLMECVDAAGYLKFWNPDGSTLDACGSATRGVADMLMSEMDTTSVDVRTNRGLLNCRRIEGGKISVEMGLPLVDWEKIPLSRAIDTISLPLPGDPTACSMGNPHCTYFVDDLASVDIASVGAKIEIDPLFPLRTNVHFVQIIDRSHIRLRIWERGGGIPLGSGSCSSGAVVGGIRRGLLDNVVQVECDGGSVQVRWDGSGVVLLAGSVEPIFSGVVAEHFLDEG